MYHECEYRECVYVWVCVGVCLCGFECMTLCVYPSLCVFVSLFMFEREEGLLVEILPGVIQSNQMPVEFEIFTGNIFDLTFFN